MSLSETQALFEDGYAKGKAGNPKDFCSHEILYSPVKYAHWYRGWKKGRIDAGHDRNPLHIWGTLLIVAAAVFIFLLPESSNDISEPKITISPPTEDLKTESVERVSQSEETPSPSNQSIKEPAEVVIAKNESTVSAVTIEQPDATAQKTHNALINRAFFTTGIENREPLDQLSEQTPHRKQLYFFSDFRNAEGQTLFHEWHYGRELMGKVEFKIKGPRWRVYSRKNIMPEWSGFWTVLIRDESGHILSQHRIEVQPE